MYNITRVIKPRRVIGRQVACFGEKRVMRLGFGWER
jgi:hypothetical protein